MKLHIPAFLPQRNRHGGVKRSEQLCELALAEHRELLFLSSSPTEVLRVLLRSPLSALRVFPVALRLGWRFFGTRGGVAVLVYGSWIHAELRRRGWPDIKLEIAPGRQILIGNILASLRIPFTVYPHNLEFMVPGQTQRMLRSNELAFVAEMRIYRHALAVRTISSFDAMILKSLGVSGVETLPYRPPAADVAELEVIREQRKSRENGFVLILGSVGNPPTRQGLERLLRMIAEHNVNRRYVMAGYETETLEALAPQCVEVRGGVNADDLRALLVDCDALLIYQPPTSGMLTRIIEASIAGIPIYVLGGYLQAKGIEDQGVYSIETLDQLP